MKKVIVLPQKYNEIRDVYTDSFFVLFNRLCEVFGFEFVFADSLKGIVADLFLIQAGVHGKGLIKESTFLPSSVKVVLCLDGVHGLPHSNAMVAPALERADYLFATSDEFFGKIWPEYKDKLEQLPMFFAPHQRYSCLQFNEKPLMRCLLTGNTSSMVYPIRSLVAGAVLRGEIRAQAIDIMRHPRWRTPAMGPRVIGGVMKSAYAKVLNQYFCSLASPSKYHYALAKYFEIPATGVLLLAKEVPDIREAGLVANKHYIPIDEVNVFDRINQCLTNPEAYRAIRLEGMEYVRTNHSVENRVQRIGEILKEL